jgi:hypothetical protein
MMAVMATLHQATTSKMTNYMRFLTSLINNNSDCLLLYQWLLIIRIIKCFIWYKFPATPRRISGEEKQRGLHAWRGVQSFSL